jgi:hypothetical protein
VPRDVLEARARALGMTLPPMGATRDEGPATRREGGVVPTPEPATSPLGARAAAVTAPLAFAAPAIPPAAPSPLAMSQPMPPPQAALHQTLASSPPAAQGSAAATMQSAMPPELRALVERADRPLAIDEVTFEDQTRVDPPPHFGGTLHSTPSAPHPSHAAAFAPPAATASVPPPYASPRLAPMPGSPQARTMPAPLPPRRGMAGTVVALVVVIAVGVLVGGGLAFWFIR